MKEFGRNAGYYCIVRYGFVDNGVGAYNGIVAYADSAEDDGAFAEADVVA